MNVLVTREADKYAKFAKLLSQAGHTPFSLPMIECVPVDAEIGGYYDFGVFTSLNAVKYFDKYKDSVRFGQIAAVGSATKAAMEKAGYTVDLMPDEFSAEGLIALFSGCNLTGKTFLMAGAETRAGNFHEWLKQNQCTAEIVTIYRTVPAPRTKEDIDAFMAENRIDVVTFASPSAVRAFFDITDTDKTIVVIGKTTADAVKKYNKDCLTPKDFTLEAMTEIINTL
ncbi:uroporphyrinogen-III synthase [Seleniivibrio sp.]|uniref:uroporphyrinogen-III synthase n=1 Tax=Seleniivibrio sp. TaxID=2898801 RepID=UPI0025EAE6BE|nr:uroporphyrinogen-III synthase [Seleniivibrio sp.]MCD8554442.1 uroporphyrinogen-III synthase [Seleniivibrio sp.]